MTTPTLREAAQQALVALVHHTEMTRPITRTADAITALRAALAQPVLTGIVGWHIRMRGCDGSADWVDLGPTPGAVPPEADALPLVYAQPVPDAPSGDEGA